MHLFQPTSCDEKLLSPDNSFSVRTDEKKNKSDILLKIPSFYSVLAKWSC